MTSAPIRQRPISLTLVRVILVERVLHPPSERVRTPGGNPRGCPASACLAPFTPDPGRGAEGAARDWGVLDHGPERLTCSARGCRATAVWGLRWNNPRLHPPERRKTWLACADHRDELERFLGVRGFLRETLPAADLPGAAP
jgi:hypothetical protein